MFLPYKSFGRSFSTSIDPCLTPEEFTKLITFYVWGKKCLAPVGWDDF